MLGSGFRKSSFFKAISLFLTVAFAIYGNPAVSLAQKGLGAPEIAPAAAMMPAEGVGLTVEKIGISIDSGTIKSKFSGKSNKVIIHIQDAHCNFEAQSNISRMLEQLTNEYGLGMISVEGAEGIVDTAWFRAFPDAEIREEVATYFMKKGEVTGAEFFSIVSDYDGIIFGAETRDYYIKNLKAFTEVYPFKEQIEKYFTGAMTVANRLKNLIYTSKLKKLDSQIKRFDDKDLELSEYADYLRKAAAANRVDIDDCGNFKKLLETLEYEKKINFDIVDGERSAYIDVLSKKLSKEGMAELVSMSVEFRKGSVKASEFYSYLRDLAREHNIPIIQEYPNLFYYYAYTKIYDGIDNEHLFKELNTIETRLKEDLFDNDNQRMLDKYAAMLSMFVNLVNIELTNEDYALYKNYVAEFSLEDVLAFMASQSDKYGLIYDMAAMPEDIASRIPKMVDFYEIAMQRDKALIDNTLKKMEAEGKDRCVLIAGGFHTQGIKNLLEKQDVSYVVVTPKITKDVETPYIKVLTNQRTSLEDIITENTSDSVGARIKATREEIIRPTKDMLNPLAKVFYTINLYLDDPANLKRLSDAIGEISGRTMEETTAETYQDMVSALVRGWLIKAKENADADLWQKALDKWENLKGAYIQKCENLAEQNDMELPELMKSAIAKEFDVIFAEEKGAETPGTPGLNAMSSKKPTPNQPAKKHTPNQHKGINHVIERIMRQRSEGADTTLSIRPTWDPKYKGTGVTYLVEVYILKGYRPLAEEYNENPVFGEAIPLDEEAHPGRGPEHDKINVYILGEEYDNVLDKNVLKAHDGQHDILRIARHELFHHLNPTLSEEVTFEATDDDLADILLKFAKVNQALTVAMWEKEKARQQRMLDETPGLHEVLVNIDYARRLSAKSEGVKIAAVVSGSETDRDNWQARLSEMSPRIFNLDGSTLVLSLQEKIGAKTREGNFLGTLLAYKSIKEASEKAVIPYRDFVSLVGMLFGRGERMSPITQAKGDRKPGIEVTPANIEINGEQKALTAIEEALLHFVPVAKYLETRGFRGILDKWGDETEIASRYLSLPPAEGESMKEWDVVKIISVLEITDELAEQKDWVVFDEEDNMLAQLSRNKRTDLISKLRELGIKPSEDGKYYAGVSLGPVAVSYDVLDIASEVFKDEIVKDGVYFDFDPYLLMALAMNDVHARWQWRVIVDGDKKLQALEKMIPDFFEKVQKIRSIFKEKYGRDLNLKTFDLGADVFWADIGQHAAMREKYLGLNDNEAKGISTRRLAGLPATKNADGNIIVNSEIAPGVKVRNSVIVNSKITGTGKIEGSTVMDSEFEGTVNMTGAFAVRSVRFGKTELKKGSGLFESLGAYDLVLEEGMRHVSVLTAEGRKDMMVSETTDLRDKANTYDVPILGNPMSFAEAYDTMFGTSMEELQTRRTRELGRVERVREKIKTYKALAFGTSGLRALVTDMTDMEVYINTRGFIRFLKETGEIEVPERKGEIGVVPDIAIAGDLRSSTPRITAAVIKAVEDEGGQPVYLGALPTPALTYYAMQNEMPSIMVTGSHIPDDRNGIKFTKKAGEVLKADEAGILRNVSRAREEVYAKSVKESLFKKNASFKKEEASNLVVAEKHRILRNGEIEHAAPQYSNDSEAAANFYMKRYLEAFPNRPLEGMKIVLYQHSAVGRDMVLETFKWLGAEVIPVGRSDDKFIPVDTEKVSPETLQIIAEVIANHNPDAVISTDGDSDRPLLADDKGRVLPGDKLGALVAMSIGADFAAFPISANGAVVKALVEKGVKVVQTKIGSPYVIAAMNKELEENPDAKVVGWEVNGGFLTGSDLTINGNKLKALPTRDAMLPLITVLAAANKAGIPVSEHIDNSLPARYTAANVVDNTIPGCENYTAQMGKELVGMFSPSDQNIAQVIFEKGSVKVITKDKFVNVVVSIKDAVEASPELADELRTVRDNLSRYFSKERGFVEIVAVNFIDGIDVAFADGSIANMIPFVDGDLYHVRPSGNAPEFRNYTAADGLQKKADALVAKRDEIVAAMVADMTAPAAQADTSPGVHAISTAEEMQPNENSPTGMVLKAVREGMPLYITPHRGQRVWGRKDEMGVPIGEYWYGAESGITDSFVRPADEGSSIPMLNVMRHAPKELLGAAVTERFGHRLPLVKILDPAKRLSVQFHDTKNELWVITGIDRTLAGKNPAVILGFSPEAVEKYGSEVTSRYEEELTTYGDALNSLISLLEEPGYNDVLNKTGDAVKAAEQIVDSYGAENIGDALEWLKTSRAELELFYNYRSVKVDDAIPIPAGTLHALTPGIQVVEHQISGKTQSMEDGATYPIRKAFPGYESEGATALDVARAGEINPAVVVGSAPEVIEEREGIMVERLPGEFGDKGLEVLRISLDKNAELIISDITSFHTLVATEKNAAQVVIGEKSYTIPQAVPGGEMLIIPASAGEFKIVAEKPVQIIDTFTPASPKEAVSSVILKTGEEIASTGVHTFTASVELTESPAKTIATDTVSVIESVPVDPIIDGRAHEVTVTQGTVMITKGKDPVTEFDVSEGETIPFEEGYEPYNVVKVGDDNVELRVNYEKTQDETAVYSAFDAVRKHIDKIRATGQIDLILPEEMFTRGGKNTPGSAQYEEIELGKYVEGDNVRITTYSAHMGLTEAAKKSINEGAIAVLVATESSINDADRDNSDVRNFLFGSKGTVRVLAIPDIDKSEELEGKGWFFNREVEATALLLAALTRAEIEIRGDGNVADDLQKLMEQLTGNAVPREYLYLMLSRSETSGILADLLPVEYSDARDPFGWLVFLAKNLLLKMPIRPFDATAQLAQRRKVMWSV